MFLSLNSDDSGPNNRAYLVASFYSLDAPADAVCIRERSDHGCSSEYDWKHRRTESIYIPKCQVSSQLGLIIIGTFLWLFSKLPLIYELQIFHHTFLYDV